jgi:glycine oxidase
MDSHAQNRLISGAMQTKAADYDGRVIVAGGGIIGLVCAWQLARRGLPVILFDAREVAAEASWAAVGMLAPGGEMEESSPLTRMALSSLAQYPAFLTQLAEASDTILEYRACGAVTMAFSESEAAALEAKAVRQSAIGILSEPVAHEGAVAARFYPQDALVNPREINAALRIACLRSGVSIREREPVLEMLAAGSGVRTSQGEYRGDGVLIASGAWSSGLYPALPPATPVRGHLIAWQPSTMLLDRMLRHGQTYVVQRQCASGRPGSVIAGGSMEYAGFDRSLDESVCADIHARAARLLPSLADLKPVARWNGLRPATGQGPLIGQLPGTRIWTAYGHYRNGILLAPETARMVVESVTSAFLKPAP